MNLTDFTALVKDTAKRGNTLDSYIPIGIRQAVRWLERNYSLQYMKKFASFTLDPNSAQPRAISLPNARVKQIEFIRFVNSDGSYAYPQKVDAQDSGALTEGMPSAFWLDGIDYIWWNATPTEETSGEIKYIQYTDWSSLTGTDEPWILANADDLVLYQSMLQLSPFIRDPNLQTMFKPLRDEAIRTLLLADEQWDQGPAREERLNYGRFD